MSGPGATRRRTSASLRRCRGRAARMERRDELHHARGMAGVASLRKGQRPRAALAALGSRGAGVQPHRFHFVVLLASGVHRNGRFSFTPELLGLHLPQCGRCRITQHGTDLCQTRHSSPGMIRRMNSSNSGTVNAVSPWLGLQIIPLTIKELRTGPSELTSRFKQSAIAPERCGPGAVARHHRCRWRIEATRICLEGDEKASAHHEPVRLVAGNVRPASGRIG